MPIPIKYAQHVTKATKMGRRAILLKGSSGTGKTYQYRALKQGGLEGLYVDVETKLGTIEDLDPPLWLVRQVDVPLTPDEKRRMLDAGTSDLAGLVEFIRSGEHAYDFIYFDSLMRYADELVAYLKYERKFTGYELWGAFGERMKRALQMLISLTDVSLPKPVHVIGTWGIEVGQDWEGKRAVVPIVDGKMVGPRIDYYFDDVLMLAKKEDAVNRVIKFLAYTGGTHEFSAKVSSGAAKVPVIIEQPNLFDIITQITKKE